FLFSRKAKPGQLAGLCCFYTLIKPRKYHTTAPIIKATSNPLMSIAEIPNDTELPALLYLPSYLSAKTFAMTSLFRYLTKR
ncbi:MAG: hypothetical protein LPK09_09140, partial [Hymenobacteraceae bacterium]|nr:hypothetical protein [Hymenobacteraceae bacterium]